MRIRYTNSIDDIVVLMRHHYQQSPAIREMFIRSQWSLALLVATLLFLFNSKVGFIPKLIPALVMGALTFFAWPHIQMHFSERQARRIYEEGKNTAALGEHELEILDDGFIERTSVTEQRCKWDAIERIESLDTHTFLFTSAMAAHVVPRASVTEGDYEAFIAAAKERWRAYVAQQGVPAEKPAVRSLSES